jgi:hypothetical protein
MAASNLLKPHSCELGLSHNLDVRPFHDGKRKSLKNLVRTKYLCGASRTRYIGAFSANFIAGLNEGTEEYLRLPESMLVEVLAAFLNNTLILQAGLTKQVIQTTTLSKIKNAFKNGHMGIMIVRKDTGRNGIAKRKSNKMMQIHKKKSKR